MLRSIGYRSVLVIAATTLVVLSVALSTNVKNSSAQQSQATVTTTVANGLRVINVESTSGKVTIKLPDDIRTGDTISGTLVEQPKGNTTEEREKNRTAIRSRLVRMMLSRAAGGSGTGTVVTPEPVVVTIPPTDTQMGPVQTSPRFGDTRQFQMKVVTSGEISLRQELDKKVADTVVIPVDNANAATTTASAFKIPTLGQTSRPVEIQGPFDGKASNSTVNLTPLKGDDPPKPEDDPLLPVVAESPRKAIVEIPDEFTGRSQIDVQDGRFRGKGVIRYVGVGLSAPTTALTRGQTTTLTINVSGLQGLRESVGMILTARGVVTMSGGMYQFLTITPAQVSPSGTYTTTRTVTGLQPGGWTASATVLTRSNSTDLCLNDDQTGAGLLLSSVNGMFEAMLPDGGFVEGKSVVKGNGCKFKFTFTTDLLKMQADVDTCSRTGTATLTVRGRRTPITDTNIDNNVCGVR